MSLYDAASEASWFFMRQLLHRVEGMWAKGTTVSGQGIERVDLIANGDYCFVVFLENGVQMSVTVEPTPAMEE
jgi:hypothetical protein